MRLKVKLDTTKVTAERTSNSAAHWPTVLKLTRWYNMHPLIHRTVKICFRSNWTYLIRSQYFCRGLSDFAEFGTGFDHVTAGLYYKRSAVKEPKVKHTA